MEASGKKISQHLSGRVNLKLLKIEDKSWTQFSSLMRPTLLMPLVSSKRLCVITESMADPFQKILSSLQPATPIEGNLPDTACPFDPSLWPTLADL